MYYSKQKVKNKYIGGINMNNFTRGIIIGSIVGTAVGAASVSNSMWMKKNIVKPSKNAIKKASRVMSDVAGML